MKPVSAAARRYWQARLALQRSGRDDMRSPPSDLWRPMVEALNAMLLAYAHPRNWTAGKPVEALDPELVREVAWLAFSEPLAGRAAPVLSSLILAHRTESPTLVEDRRAAVRFLAAARAGLIPVDDPQKAVRCAFDIPRQTLARWETDLNPDPLPEPPPGADEATWRADISAWLTISMRKAGEHYRAFRHVKARAPAKGGALRASRA